jgi:outer membrane receptor for ferrienterochelin and colicins
VKPAQERNMNTKKLRPTAMAVLVIASAGSHAQVAADPKEATLEAVRVKAAREEVEGRIEAPNPVVVIGREDIEKTNDLTLGDFLRRQPGISFSGPAGNIKDIRMRGLDKGYTQILVDGEPWLGSTKERQIQVDQLPMSMVERVEIIRSPLPNLPADGIGGTINIVLRRASGDELNVKLGAGAVWFNGTQQPQASVQINYAKVWDNGLSLVLPFNVNHRHELKIKPKIVEAFDPVTGTRTSLTESREVEDNRVREFTLGPRLVYRPDTVDTFTLNAFVNLNDGDKHKTTESWLSLSPADGTSFIGAGSSVEDEDKDRSSLMVGGQWQRKLSDVLTGTVGLGTQRASEDKLRLKTSYNLLGVVTGAELEDATVRAYSHKVHGDLRWAASDRHLLASGVELRTDGRKDKKLKDGVQQTGLGDRFDIEETKAALWLRDDWQIAPEHLLVPGLRYEWRSTESVAGDGSRRSGSNGALNPSVAYRWEFAKHWRARAAAAQTLRTPKFENLTTAVASGSGTSTSPFVSGNPDLQPEKSKGFDLGVEHDFFGGTAFAALNYSQRFITDAVEKRTVEEEAGVFYNRPYNVPGTSRTRAIEVDGRFDLRPLGLRDVTVLANYSRFFSRKAGSNDPLGDQPRYVANTGMDWRVPSLKTLFGWRYNYQGRIDKASGETESPQHLLDAFAYWDINRDWSLRVSGSNLLDTRKTKYKPTLNSSGVLTGLTREQERGGRGLLLTLEARL